MLSPSAVSELSENVVVYCARLRSALSVSLYVKHQTCLPLPGHVSHSACFTRCSQALQCTGQRVQWSVKVTQTMYAARKPTARPLYRGRCVSYVVIISITRYRDIDRGFVQRTISWRPYIVRYRARTHIWSVRCSHTAAAASSSD